MKRHTKGPAFDISIRGDDLEQNRIQLEHNLQNTDISFRLSSVSDGDEHNRSLEYPRHNSEPSAFPEFTSPEQRSRDHFDGDTHSQIHAWSYRTADDEDGINPYGGGTVSTAAHHASALTLSAGLGGGRGARRDVSLSGAEYDPERPLHDMIAGVDSKISVFDIEPSRSKYPGAGSVTFDPLVVDSTAELDRILQSGYAPQPTSRFVPPRSPPQSSSSSSASDSDNGQSNNPRSRPKLSDSLRRVSFSPKRPRSPQSNRSDPPANRNHHPVSSPLARTDPPHESHKNMPTPKPSKRVTAFPSHTSTTSHPEVRLQPPTPSTAGSKFTRMARGLAKELEAEKSHWEERKQRVESSRLVAAPADMAWDKNPSQEIVNYHNVSATIRQPTSRRLSVKHQVTPTGKLHLPDVTGLTSAVESPAKTGYEYYRYADDRPRDSEARLLKTLSAVQAKLQHLEEENSISRRRVRELELELEVCKRDVARERTRMLEREDVLVQQLRDVSMRKNKGKGRVGDLSLGNESQSERYKEAVEEKKALEALITTLRTHLTRLTSELSAHKELLAELRTLRESDSRMLKEKSGEIDRLKAEVERLAGEVEVLRGVVEEGLKERRAVREVSVQQSIADLGMSEDMSPEEEGEQSHVIDVDKSQMQQGHEEDENDNEEKDDDDDDEPEPFDPVSIQGSSRVIAGNVDRTMRTDRATLGSSQLAPSTPGARFMDSGDFERISAEVEERRSNRSMSILSQLQSRSRSPSPTVKPFVEDVTDRDEPPRDNSGSQSRRIQNPHQAQRQPITYSQPSSRPSAPTPAHASIRNTQRAKTSCLPVLETPFPQIRGTHLERLFFSAPEHNAKTCTVCHRRRRRPNASSPTWFQFHPSSGAKAPDEDVSGGDATEDEGFAEGSEEPDHSPLARWKGKQPEQATFPQDYVSWQGAARREGLPPQTVLVRVIRELEDDFTHYKSIYVELADQYKDMDAVSNVSKRNILAQHLREVVDILEQKGDQIASLYDLLSFKDKLVSESVVQDNNQPPPTTTSSWGRRGGLRKHPTTLA